MTYADKHTSDNRTPQELAKLILNHPMRPQGTNYPALSFGEALLYTGLSEYDEKEFWYALKHIADGRVIPDHIRNDYKNGLKIVQEYETFFTATKDAMSERAKKKWKGPLPHSSADDLIEGLSLPGPTTDTALISTKAHESMLEDTETLRNNLHGVHSLMEALSKKPGFQMDVPRKGRSR